jgi:hypothetical protein
MFKISQVYNLSPLSEALNNFLDLSLHNLYPLLKISKELTVSSKALKLRKPEF